MFVSVEKEMYVSGSLQSHDVPKANSEKINQSMISLIKHIAIEFGTFSAVTYFAQINVIGNIATCGGKFYFV